MFTHLNEILNKFDISISLSKKDDKISFAILPKSKDEKAKINIAPLVGSGTAEELEEHIGDVIQKGLEENTDMISKVEEFSKGLKKTVAKEEKKSTPATSSSSSSSGSSKTTPAATKPEDNIKTRPAKINKAENKSYDAAIKSIEDAKKRKDDGDMLDFFEKQAVKHAEEVKSLPNFVELVKAEFEKIRNGKAEPKAPEQMSPDAGGLFANTEGEGSAGAKEKPKAESKKAAPVKKKEEKPASAPEPEPEPDPTEDEDKTEETEEIDTDITDDEDDDNPDSELQTEDEEENTADEADPEDEIDVF